MLQTALEVAEASLGEGLAAEAGEAPVVGRADRYQVVVHVPVETLFPERGFPGDVSAETPRVEQGPRLVAETARRLACDRGGRRSAPPAPPLEPLGGLPRHPDRGTRRQVVDGIPVPRDGRRLAGPMSPCQLFGRGFSGWAVAEGEASDPRRRRGPPDPRTEASRWDRTV